MATYTRIPLYDLKKIAVAYGLEAVDFIPIKGGNANSNYHIRAVQGDYMLTLAEEKSLQEVRNLAALLQQLEQSDFMTSKVHSSLKGEIVT
jgi:homoserine kinase type II